MTAVFVHGVPETADIWDPLIAELGRTDCVTLQLPGFGCDAPDEFQPTMDGYAAWMAEEIAPFDEVDLVGHDWGGLLALRVAADNPPNLRTWCVDSPDVTPGFEWHEGARGWQTPQRGEAVAQWLATGPDDDRLEALVGLGLPRRFADQVIEHIDVRMTSSMLQLYRSAENIGSSWGPRLDTIKASGFCIGAGRDLYRADGAVAALASRLDADLLSFPDLGHFWMLEDPRAVAAALERAWATL